MILLLKQHLLCQLWLLCYLLTSAFAQDTYSQASTATSTVTTTLSSSSTAFSTTSSATASLGTITPSNTMPIATTTNSGTVTATPSRSVGAPSPSEGQEVTESVSLAITTTPSGMTSDSNHIPQPSNTGSSTVQGTGWNYNANDQQVQHESWLKEHNRFIFIIFVGLFLFSLLFWYIYKSVKAMRRKLEEENQNQLYMMEQATGGGQSTYQNVGHNSGGASSHRGASTLLDNNSSQQPVFQPAQQQSIMTMAVGTLPTAYQYNSDKTEVEDRDNATLPSVTHPRHSVANNQRY